MNKKLKKNKYLVFYCRASSSIGFGHLSRLNALASMLNKMNYTSILVGPQQKYINLYQKKVFKKVYEIEKVTSIREDINFIVKITKKYNSNLLILDDYRIRISDQKIILKNNIKWLQFDLYGKNPLYADIILNYSPNAKNIDYYKLIKKPKSYRLLGPKYTLLRNEFHKLKTFKIKKNVKKIFICFGGGDDRGGILKIVKSIKKGENNIKIDIATGKDCLSNKSLTKVLSADKNINIHYNTNNIKKIIYNSDLAIISGGTISYECAAIGIPMIIMSIEKNQVNTSKFWMENKSAIYLGHINKLNSKKIKNEFERLCNNFELRKTFSTRAKMVCDGKGSKKVALNIDQFIKSNKRL